MKNALTRLLTLFSILVMGWAAPLAAADSTSLQAHAYLLVGFPDAESNATPGTLVVPGTVIPIDASGSSTSDRFGDEDRTAGITEVADNLRSSLRLSSVDVRYAVPRIFQLNVAEELPGPSPGSPLFLRATLLGASDELASFHVQFQQGPVILADTKVAIPLGKRAVIGGLDGKEAPYIFLVLEPMKKNASSPVFVGDGITPPRALSRVQPQYTLEGRKERIQGVVIMQAIIEKDGRVSDVKVLKGLPFGLDDAAAKAIRQWTFDPALDADGNPIRVYYNLTINFRLNPNDMAEEGGQ